MNNALHIAAACLSTDARIKSYLSMLRSADWSVDIIAYKEDNLPDYEERDRQRTYRISPRYQGKSVLKYLLSYMRFYRAAKKLARQLHKEREYRFVHAHNMPNVIVGIAASLKPAPRIFLDMHDLMSMNYKTKFGNNVLAVKGIKFEEVWSISKADQVICADKGQKHILKQLHDNIDPTVIMNLANSGIFAWENHSWQKGVFRFVYHGTIAWRLGVDRVIEALRYLPENVVFRLIGDGDGKENVMQMIKQYNLETRVEVYPFVQVETLPELLRDCHAGIIPSRRTEATDTAMLPVKLMEYSALGIPSVVSKLKNIELHFGDNQVLYFEPESQESMQKAMFDLQNSEVLRLSILLGLKDFNKKYNWRSGEETYLGMIEDICEH